MARGDQLSRQWKIIQVLAAARSGKTVSELAAALECHPRSVYRDLEALQGAGFPLYSDWVEGKNRWTVLNGDRHQVPIPFSLTELMALYFSRSLVRVTNNTFFHDSLAGLFQKIKAVLPPEYLDYLDGLEARLGVAPGPYKPDSNLKAVIEDVGEAIEKRRVVEIAYDAMSRGKRTLRRVMPYKIWFFDNAFYLIGGCLLREEIRVFALERIRALRLTDASFTFPEDFDIEATLRDSFGVFLGERQTVRVWFSAAAAGYVRERVWHRSQKIEACADGAILFEAEVAGTREIKFWILRWGAEARVLAPRSLRDELAREAQRMADGYRNCRRESALDGETP